MAGENEPILRSDRGALGGVIVGETHFNSQGGLAPADPLFDDRHTLPEEREGVPFDSSMEET